MTALKRIGIAGCGTIGRKVATELDRGTVPNARLAAINGRDMDKAREFAVTLASPPPVLSVAEMAPLVDLVVEAANGAALGEIAMETLSAGKDLIALSCGALLERDDLFALAREKGATIYIPSGAIAGLDGVASAAAGRIDSVTMITRKPPDGLRGAPGVDKAGVALRWARGEGVAAVPGQHQRVGRPEPGRYRRQRDHDTDLCRPDGRAQHPRNRGRGRVREAGDKDRGGSVRRQPPDRRAVCSFGSGHSAEDHLPPEGGNLNPKPHQMG